MRRLIIDGYNVVHASERYRALARDDLSAARDRLVEDVAGMCGGASPATVVFDGARVAAEGRERTVGGVAVVFTREGEDADGRIERIAREARQAGDEVTVVTSDAVTQWTTMGPGVLRMSSAEFLREVAAGSSEWREHTPSGRRRATIEDRIDDTARTTLLRMRHPRA